MSLSLPAVTALVVGRLETDVEGQAVRARLGAGAGSIIRAEDLGRIEVPARPLLAYRRNPVPTLERVVRILTLTWWIYDDREQGHWRIDDLLGEIPLAYEARRLDQQSGGVIGDVAVGDAGEQRFDATLGLNISWIRVYITAG